MQSRAPNLKTIWMSILFGLLIATAPNWLNEHHQANYDAPWNYPAVSK